MSFMPLSAKKSLRFVFVSTIIFVMSVVGLAAGWETVTSFASELTGSARAALFGDAQETKSNLPEDDAPAFVIGTCDTTGPVEVEGSVVGTTPTAYVTLGAAFAAINGGIHTGAVTVEICGDTNEGTTTATLNASGTGSSSYTSIAINPVGGAARNITGAATAGSPMIDLSGADNVTINGLNTGGNALTIANTTASATSGTATIRFIGGASSNTITNATILGSNSASVATNGGVIFFSTDAVSGNGNDNNSISANNIGPAGSNLPSKAIVCNGSTGTQAVGNSGLIIDNNNIFDFFGAAVTSAGVAVNGGCNTFSITNNRFYQTAARTWTTGALHTPILMNSSATTSGVQGMTISGNTIGFASNTQTGTYSLTGSTGSFQGIRFIGITAGTISNINSNTIAGISLTGVTSSGTGVSSPFTGIHIGGSSFLGNANVNNNTIGSLSANGSLTFATTTTNTTDVYGIYNIASDAWTSNGNSIGGISVTNSGASGTFVVYGIRANTASTTTWTANNNIIGGTVANSIQLNATGTGSQVIGLGATTAPSSFTGNTIRNLTSNTGTGTSSSASVIGIAVSTSTPNHTLSQNTIYNLGNTNATAATVVTGIHFTGSTANVVERNLIYGLTSATTSASAEINGIRVAGGTTNYRNNMIALGTGITNALGSAATNSGTTGINGFNGALGTDTFVHNSIYIGGSPTAGTGASFAFNGTQTTNTRSFRDNIFFNARSNSGATGKNYAVKINGTTANPTGLTINNNIYFANGSGGVFGFFNSADVANIAAWRTAVGQDASSFEANPQFSDPTNATPDLHLHPTTQTVAEGNGALIAAVTDDFDGQNRSGLTPVDIGADAGNFTGLDLTPPTISYTSLSNTTDLNDRTLAMSASDVSGAPTAGAGLPVLYFRKGTSGGFAASQCVFLTGANYSCAIAYSLVGGVAAGDTIQYYVAAQDTLNNVAVSPSTGAGGLTANPPAAATAPTSPSSYQILTAISGAKTVGAGGDYPTLTSAIAAVNAALITGPVTLSLTDSTYSTAETFPLTINANNGSSSTNTVTIKPAAGVSPVITGSNVTCILALSGADWVVVDGSNAVGGTSKDLTISNTNTSGGTVCYSNGATNNTLKNSVVTGVTTSTSNGVVFMSTVATGAVGNSTNTIQNNDLRGGATSPAYIFFNSGSASPKNSANVITQNRVFNFSNTGIRDDGNSVGATYSGNEIFEAAVQSTSLTGFRPSATSIDGFTFTRNSIHDLNTTNTGNVYGIHLFDTSTAATSEISNNMITLSPAAPLTVRGIYDQTALGEKFNVVFNSVYLGGTGTGASNSEAYFWSIASTTSARNNILVNARTGGTGKHYAYRLNSTLANIISDYNDIYATGGTGNVFGNDGTADRADLAAWQAATAKDAASKSVDPLFVSTSDLHIAVTSPVESQGITVAGLTVDFDGETRPATPDIGADEVTAAPPGTIQFSSASYSVAEGTPLVTLTVTRTGGSSGAVTANYSLSGVSAIGGAACLGGVDFLDVAGSVTFADGDTADKTFTIGVCDDASFDPSEIFSAALSIGSGTATLGTPALSTVLINDNDTAPSLQFSQANYGVGEVFASTTLTVTRTGATENAASANYQTTSNSATGGASCAAGIDYIDQVGTVNFAAGEVSNDIVVTLCPDSLYEGDEMFSIALSAPFGVTVLGTPSTANVIIVENDGAPVLEFSSATYTNSDDIAKNTGRADQFAPTVASITVTRSGATENVVSVDYATIGGGTAAAGPDCSAGSGVDYVFTNGALNFAAGEVSKSFDVLVCSDALFEGNETVNLALSNATSPATIGANNAAVLTINDNDPQPSLQFSSSLYTNSDDIARLGVTTAEIAPSVATITVTRTGAVENAVGVDYSTGGGTATSGATCSSGVDYIGASGTLSFAAGEVSKDFTVTVCTDALFEGEETVSLVLSTPTGSAALGTPNFATLLISDNDPQPTLQFSSPSYSVNEAGPTATITVSRTGASDNLVTVGYLTTGGTATAGGGTCGVGIDYAATSGLLTFAPGELSQTISVAICDDAVAENAETVSLALQNPTGGAVIGPVPVASLTINDDDAVDYTVTTTGNAIVVNDNKNNDDSMGINGTGPGVISFDAAGRSFQVDGGPILSGGSGNVSWTGATSITVNGQGGNDTFIVNVTDTGFPSLVINGGTGNDFVLFNGTIDFAAGSNLDLDLQNDDPTPGVDLITVNAELNFTGTGSATFRSSQAITIGSALVTVVDGDLTIEANRQAVPTSGSFRGVTINSAGHLETSGSGDIVVKGRGGIAAGVAGLRGVFIPGGTLKSTSTAPTAGTITIDGIGGAGTANGRGVEITLNTNAVTSVSGDISITGQGGLGTVSANSGVQITAAAIRSTGSAKVTIEGTGGGGTSSQVGVRVTNAGGEISSTGGDIVINGFGGTAVTGASNHGVSVALGAAVNATNGARITIYGVGGGGSGSNAGVVFGLPDPTVTTQFAKIASDSGQISITGVAGTGLGGGNIGANINGGGTVQGTGPADVNITGTGGSGGDDNYGLDFESADNAGTTVSTAAGNLTINGSAVATSGLRQNGIRFEDSVGSQVYSMSTGSGNLTLTATSASTDPTSSALEFADDANLNLNGPSNTISADTITVGTSQVTISATNNLVIKPVSPNRLVDLGGADSATTLGLSDDELDIISAGVLTLGGPATGNVSVTSDISRTNPTTLNIVTGADIGINSGSIANAGGVTTLDAAGAVYVPNAGVDSLAATTKIPAGRVLRFDIGTAVPDTGYSRLNVVGGVNITDATLSLAGISTPIGGEVYTIVENDLSDAVVGTFAALPEGATITNIVGSGLNATISYVGGSGNDVVLTVETPPSSIQLGAATASAPESASSVSIPVTRTGSTVLPASVSYSTTSLSANGGASCASGVDFVNASGTLSFATGETSKNIVVTICPDSDIEFDETFTASISNATGGATLGTPTSATVTITNDDFDATPPTVVYTPLANVAGSGDRTFSVTATDNVGVTGVAVFWVNNGNTASAPSNACSFVSGNIWNCTIVATAGTVPQTNPGTVSYFVTATDAAANSTNNPATAPNLFTIGSNGTIDVTNIASFDTMIVGSGFTLGGNATVSNNLTLSGGTLLTGANTLTLGCNATVTGAGGPNYVIGTIEKQFCGPQSFSFPLGTAANGSLQDGATQLGALPEFTPVDVNVTSMTAPSSLVATVVDGVITGGDPAQSASRYWDINLVGGPLTADLTFHYLDQDIAGNEANYRILRRSTGSTIYPGGVVNPAANTGFAPAVSAFSQWAVGNFVPTAANVEVSGAVKTASGAGIGDASVMLTGGDLAEPVYVRTNSFGNYRFSDLPAGRTYVVTVVASRYRFGQPSQVMMVDDSIEGLDFIADPQ